MDKRVNPECEPLSLTLPPPASPPLHSGLEVSARLEGTEASSLCSTAATIIFTSLSPTDSLKKPPSSTVTNHPTFFASSKLRGQIETEKSRKKQSSDSTTSSSSPSPASFAAVHHHLYFSPPPAIFFLSSPSPFSSAEHLSGERFEEAVVAIEQLVLTSLLLPSSDISLLLPIATDENLYD
ncbi:hypothetical protein K1719_026032 [Acacia pycnantha]|nr:hypothetical protein K1719_026032 [Acacia pycnantha]